MNTSYLSSLKNTVLSSKPSTTIRLLLMALFFSITPFVSFGQSQTFSTPGTYTFNVPAGVTSLNVQAWGSGGGGSNISNRAGGGGAFAGMNIITAGGTYTITVGAGAGAGTGNDGQDSSFGTLVIAKGGTGGVNSGTGGLASASTGNVKFNGGNGGTSTIYYGGAGGGGAGGTLAVGSVGANTSNDNGGNGGIGGNAGGGNGGNGGYISNNGINGFFPGGGGGERGENGYSSGGGGNGQVIVSWAPSPTITSFTPSNACAASGASVVITGTNFTGSTAVKFNGISASFTVNSNTQITAQLPALATSGTLTVTTSGGTATGATSFTASPTPSAPTVGIITQPTCTTATGSVVLNGLPSGSWMLNRSPGNVTTTGSGTSTTISGIPQGTYTYTYTVNSLNNGLYGEYFNNITLTGLPVLTRTDATVDFNWDYGSPDASINVNQFSVRWSGLIQPLNSEIYTFSTSSDDGIRLWVNGVQVINNWTDHGTTTNTGTIALTAGIKYNIVLEYYDGTGGAVSRLSWSSPTNPTSVIIPTTQLFSDPSCGSLASANVVINAQPTTPSAPTVGIITQPTCTTATGSVVLNGLPAGNWMLTRSPGSATTTGTGTSTTLSGLPQGTNTYTVNSLNNGLKGEYFNNIELTGSPVLTRTDATVDYNWGEGRPDASINVDNFSVRWSGLIQPLYSETYAFTTTSDDGIRLWVNGVQIINNWSYHSVATNTASIALNAGVKYSIIVEYFEGGGGAVSTLSWSSPSQVSQIIPTAQLYSVSSCGSGASESVFINVQPTTPSAPTVGTITQPDCTTATGSVVLNSLPTGSWMLTRSPGNVTTTGAGTSTTISALSSGTYTYSVKNNGLKGEYFNNMTLTGSPALIRTDATVDFNWWGGSPDPLINVDNFSVRWSGLIQPLNSETYTFTTRSDDGIRLWVNGTQLINNWNDHSAVNNSGSILLTAGVKYDIVLEYYENGGDALSQLSWSSPTNPTSVIIPTTQLYSSCGGSPASANVVINPVNTTWNGTVWDNGTPPTINGTQNLVFNADYPGSTDLSGCSCTVNTGALKINSGNNLILGGKLTVNPPGTITFEDTSSLVQTAFTGANSGNIIYKRKTTAITKMDYTYWSTPVMSFTLGGVSPNTSGDKMYSFNSSIEDWNQESPSTSMVAGLGYIIRGPQDFVSSASIWEAPFVGVPNNGDINITGILANKSYLLGNPYPSAMDADKFLQANINTLGGTLYFWTHNTAMQNRNLISTTAGLGAYAYTSNDYATYNGTGGVGAHDSGSSISAGINPGVNSSIPSGKIASGQGFFASSLVSPTSTTVSFNNTMRVAGTILMDKTGTNEQFFKTKNPTTKTANTIEKHRVWLNLSNTKGAFKQTLIGYITDATNEYDSRFDGESFDGQEFIDFYSINQDKNLVIQGRALPFDENDEVLLGYRTTINGEFKINIDQVDGSLTNQAVFIEDKLTNTMFDLKRGNYTFNTLAGTFNDRFVLRYTNKTLGTNDLAIQSNRVLISIKNKQIKVNSFDESIDRVTVYDLLGKQIYQKEKVSSNEFILSDFVSSHQTLIVKTSLQNGKIVTDKIIY